MKYNGVNKMHEIVLFYHSNTRLFISFCVVCVFAQEIKQLLGKLITL